MAKYKSPKKPAPATGNVKAGPKMQSTIKALTGKSVKHKPSK